MSNSGLSLAQQMSRGDTGNPLSTGSPGWLAGKSVVFLFLHGGPSQFETFDPKMDAPSEIRSVTGEIKTTLPGITFGSTFERLARMVSNALSLNCSKSVNTPTLISV